MSRIFTFKELSAIAFRSWSLEDCRYVYKNTPRTQQVKISVAEYVAKKKFSTDLSKEPLQSRH